MQTLRFLTFDSIYAFHNSVGYEVKLDGRICYAPVKYHLQGLCTFEIYLIRDPMYIVQKNRNNYCRFTRDQIHNYLRRIQTICPFEYKIELAKYEEWPCYKITMFIKGRSVEIMFVLQCIRRLYEYPYSFYLYHAYKLQEQPKFKFTSILNLYNAVWSAHNERDYDGHSFSGKSYFVTYKELCAKLRVVTFASELYQTCNITAYAYDILREYDKDCVNYGIGDLDKWDSCFEKFLPYYIKNYEILKH